MNNAAYEFEKLGPYSVKIECIAVYDDYLVVGNRLGHILWYTTSPKLKLLNADQTFSDKPILQLAAVSREQIIICLSAEKGVSILKFKETPQKLVQCNTTNLPYTKGASCFDLDVKTLAIKTHKNGPSKKRVRLCVAVKKQLNLYVWNGKQFLQFPSIHTRLDAPQSLMWCSQSIIIGCKNEYFLVNVNTKLASPLILTGICQEPIIVKISDTTFGLVKDSQLIVMNSTTDNPNRKQIIKFNDMPYSITYDMPYLLVSYEDKLCIQTVEPYDGNNFVRQEITTNSKILKMISCENGLIYAMSAMEIWCFNPVPFGVQIERLLEDNCFQLALKLANILDKSVNDKGKNETRVRNLYAKDLFEKKKYRESLNEFLKLNIDPHYVIELYSNVMPQCYLNNEKEITDEETETKIYALIEYLIEARYISTQLSDSDHRTDAGETNSNKEELLEAIDIALLKCYLQTNDALIAPIIRLNHCGLSETETTLKNYKKYNELIILYQVKGLHRKALEFLKQQSDDTESILYGPEKTIEYLQFMESKDIDVVLEFSDWVLDKYPERGLKIFTGDVGEVEQWPRWEVYRHLTERHNTGLSVQYLEHVIHVWNDTDSVFHNSLVQQYVKFLRRHDSNNGASSPPDTKEKLLTLLERSDYYSLESTLELFPLRNECFEERIRVLEKLGYHEQVLSIYVYKVNDIDRAIEYCDKIYASKNKNSDRVKFLIYITARVFMLSLIHTSFNIFRLP